ncbi:hypothetical protein SEA_WEISS13_4 [Mycobacterium phage Weiss13]|uniref:Uncharacterized protein n=2 Tax=Papyrusvirus send513 TaxID=1982556 RepID=A0A0Y0DAI6_9CAUD|nr:hypothetical protein SEA_WEISS13_4 [Mycobacterium phage Weiss13]AYQ98578.1 hypothetical protein SEA_RIPARIAN_4 [Mycobacterium phage Riparian]
MARHLASLPTGKRRSDDCGRPACRALNVWCGCKATQPAIVKPSTPTVHLW